MSLQDILYITDIGQNIVLILATVVAAWWAYTTLDYKEKTEELLSIARKVIEIHSHIEQSISLYNSYKILFDLSQINLEKFEELRSISESRLETLKSDLDSLKEISLRLSVTFRFIDLTMYQLEIINMEGIEKWGTKENQLMEAKFKILAEIYKEINSHRNIIRRLSNKLTINR